MSECIDHNIEHHYSFDAEHLRLGARYRADGLDKELFLFAYLPDDYNADHVQLGLAELDRHAGTAIRIAVQAVAAEREACALVVEEWEQMFDRRATETQNLAVNEEMCTLQAYTKDIAAAIRARAEKGQD